MTDSVAAVRTIVRHTWLGLVLVLLAMLCALVVTQIWGDVVAGYGWRGLTLTIMFVGTTLLAAIEELRRPQNPYTNIDPRFSYLDAGPTGRMQRSSTGWLWHALPPAIASAAIVLSWVLS